MMNLAVLDQAVTPVRISVGGSMWLDADVVVPSPATGVVLFAQASASGRRSLRNREVASELNELGFATVLADLLTPEEEHFDERTRMLRFDIPMLAARMVRMVDWSRLHDAVMHLPVGLYGTSTGVAAALDAAAARPEIVRAVVSRSGRPDLAAHLDGVSAPVLLIVGGDDVVVLDLNREALRRIHAVTRLEIVPGASHLFEEPGTLGRVAALAGGWFTSHLQERQP